MHTKGPWHIDKRIGAPEIVGTSTEYGARRIARVLYDPGSEDIEVRANARLIAAAPELLEALEVIANIADQSGLSSQSIYDGVLEDINDIANESVRKAKEE